MALEFNAKKTEHSGAKNMGHSKAALRSILKVASKKLWRARDRKLESDARSRNLDSDQ